MNNLNVTISWLMGGQLKIRYNKIFPQDVIRLELKQENPVRRLCLDSLICESIF